MKQLILFTTLFFTLGGFWWTFSSFQQDEKSMELQRQELIEAAVLKKIDEFITIRKKKCLEDRLTTAGLMVDSILIARAKSQRDTVNKPAKPFKPERPEIMNLEDTTPIAPILQIETDSSKKQ